MPKVVLSHKQFAIILYVYILGASVLFIPEATRAGKDSYLSTIFATVIGMMVLAAWLYLHRKYPEKSLIQAGIKIVGPWIGYPVGFYLAYIIFLVAMLIIEDMAILASIIMLPNTPPGVIRLSFIFVAVYACYKGVESIARMCELVLLPMTLLVLVLPILEFEQLGVGVFQPVYIIDWFGVLMGTVSALSFPFAEIVAPVMLLPFVSQDKESEKYYHLAIFAAGVLLLIRTLVGLMLFGPDLLNRFTLPIIAIFRALELGIFFNRLEGLFLGLWYIGLLLKLSITLYAGVLVLSQLFGIKRMENLWIPISALLFFGGQNRFMNLAEFGFFSAFVKPFISLPGEILWPLLLVSMHWLKGRLKPPMEVSKSEPPG